MAALRFRDVQFTEASERDREQGLLGFVAVSIGPLRLDAISVRRTLHGRLVLSFPTRKDGQGRSHPVIRPLGDRERRQVEFEILGQLSLEGGGR